MDQTRCAGSSTLSSLWGFVTDTGDAKDEVGWGLQGDRASGGPISRNAYIILPFATFAGSVTILIVDASG